MDRRKNGFKLPMFLLGCIILVSSILPMHVVANGNETRTPDGQLVNDSWYTDYDPSANFVPGPTPTPAPRPPQEEIIFPQDIIDTHIYEIPAPYFTDTVYLFGVSATKLIRVLHFPEANTLRNQMVIYL